MSSFLTKNNLSSEDAKKYPNVLHFGILNSENILNSSDGRVVRASALGAVDLGLIPSRVKPMTLKLVLTASVLDAQH